MAETTKSVTTLEIGEEGSSFAIPVSMKKIKTTTDVTLDSATLDGNPVGLSVYDLVTGEQVIRNTLRRGIFRSKPNKSKKGTWGDFVEVKPEDIEVIEEATKLDSFVVEHFIPLADVPMERIQDAYFLAPAEGMTAKPLVLLARAMKRRKVAGVFKMVKSSRQHLAVVYEQDGGLIVNTLAFAGDFTAVREAAEALKVADVKISKAEQAMAEKVIEAWASDASVIDGYEDDLIPLKADLVERAIQGKELPKKKRAPREPVGAPDDLTELLSQSVKNSKSPSKRGAAVA